MVKNFKFYAHSSKESNRDTWESTLGGDPNSEAADDFVYCGYEIEFLCAVDMETGQVEAFGVVDRGETVRFERPICLT